MRLPYASLPEHHPLSAAGTAPQRPGGQQESSVTENSGDSALFCIQRKVKDLTVISLGKVQGEGLNDTVGEHRLWGYSLGCSVGLCRLIVVTLEVLS